MKIVHCAARRAAKDIHTLMVNNSRMRVTGDGWRSVCIEESPSVATGSEIKERDVIEVTGTVVATKEDEGVVL